MNITTDGTPGGGNTSTLVRGKSSSRIIWKFLIKRKQK